MTMIPAAQSITLPHGRLTYRQAGRPGAPALVLLHGIGSTSPRWEHQFAGLSNDFHVIAWNAPGYRDSDPLPGAAPRVEDYAHALAGLLDALDVREAWLVSNSWGTLIALSFAREYPQRVLGLVLGGPTAGYGHLPAGEQKTLADKRAARIASAGPVRMIEEDSPNLVSPQAGAELLARLRQGGDELTVEGYAQAARMLYATEGLVLVAQLEQPILILSGEQDRITPPPANAHRLLAAARHGEIEMLPGVGHLPHLEVPERFNAAVRGFIKKNTRPETT
jgi:pimeloyl-ACP methyl ester carboxylesterase